MPRRSDPITRLRTAIDCLPAETRRAMLDGLDRQPVVVGGYTDSRGGVCPMLAAHREGALSPTLAFARAWDNFSRTGRVRRATERELRILRSQLTASLLAEETGHADFAVAICEHEAAMARRRAAEAVIPPRPERRRTERPDRSGDPDRRLELRDRPQWAWLRPVRTLHDYERALARLERAAIERDERDERAAELVEA